MYKIEFYVPHSHLEIVKKAMFEKGAGQIGAYGECCWQIEGHGQFKPLSGSRPYKGESGILEEIKEWKVEMVCSGQCIKESVSALVTAHPYEEPAYSIFKIDDKSTFL